MLDYIKKNPKFFLEITLIVVGLITMWVAMEFRISALEEDLREANIIELKEDMATVKERSQIILDNLQILLTAKVNE